MALAWQYHGNKDGNVISPLLFVTVNFQPTKFSSHSIQICEYSISLFFIHQRNEIFLDIASFEVTEVGYTPNAKNNQE